MAPVNGFGFAATLLWPRQEQINNVATTMPPPKSVFKKLTIVCFCFTKRANEWKSNEQLCIACLSAWLIP